MAFGVIACNAIKVIIARLVGSAIAWKMSRLILFNFFIAQLIGCKYKCNYSVSQIFCKIFFQKENAVTFEIQWLRFTITANLHCRSAEVYSHKTLLKLYLNKNQQPGKILC